MKTVDENHIVKSIKEEKLKQQYSSSYFSPQISQINQQQYYYNASPEHIQNLDDWVLVHQKNEDQEQQLEKAALNQSIQTENDQRLDSQNQQNFEELNQKQGNNNIQNQKKKNTQKVPDLTNFDCKKYCISNPNTEKMGFQSLFGKCQVDPKKQEYDEYKETCEKKCLFYMTGNILTVADENCFNTSVNNSDFCNEQCSTYRQEIQKKPKDGKKQSPIKEFKCMYRKKYDLNFDFKDKFCQKNCQLVKKVENDKDQYTCQFDKKKRK